MACPAVLAPSDCPAPGVFEAIYRALEASSSPVIGPVQPRLLVIPLHDEDGAVAGGLWGCTVCRWLHVQMLFVPEAQRGCGVGAALMAAAEAEAWERGCLGVHVDALSFQAAPFYRKIGYQVFGVLDDFPPGHRRIFFRKRLDGVQGPVAPGGSRAEPSCRRRAVRATWSARQSLATGEAAG